MDGLLPPHLSGLNGSGSRIVASIKAEYSAVYTEDRLDEMHAPSWSTHLRYRLRPTVQSPRLLAGILPGLQITGRTTHKRLSDMIDRSSEARYIRVLPQMVNLVQSADLREPGSNRSNELPACFNTFPPSIKLATGYLRQLPANLCD